MLHPPFHSALFKMGFRFYPHTRTILFGPRPHPSSPHIPPFPSPRKQLFSFPQGRPLSYSTELEREPEDAECVLTRNLLFSLLSSKSHLFPSYHPLPPPSFYFIVSACRSLPLPAHFWKIEAFSSLSLSPGSILLRFPLSPLGSRSFAIRRDGRKGGISGFALREKKAYPFFHLFPDFSGPRSTPPPGASSSAPLAGISSRRTCLCSAPPPPPSHGATPGPSFWTRPPFKRWGGGGRAGRTQ